MWGVLVCLVTPESAETGSKINRNAAAGCTFLSLNSTASPNMQGQHSIGASPLRDPGKGSLNMSHKSHPIIYSRGAAS